MPRAKGGRPRQEETLLKHKTKMGRPKKIEEEEKEVKTMDYDDMEASKVMRPPPAFKRVSVKTALRLIKSKYYYMEVIHAGYDALYAFRYLRWRLGNPHRSVRAKKLIMKHKANLKP